MGQASSHERKRRGKKSTQTPAEDSEEKPAARRKPGVNKNGKRTSKKKAKRLGPNEEGDPQHQTHVPSKVRRETQDTARSSGYSLNCEVNPDSPRYGIFDDLKPTVCIDDDGVSLSSTESGEVSLPRRTPRSANVLRNSSRRMRRTYSSRSRKSRAAKLAKKAHKPKSSDTTVNGDVKPVVQGNTECTLELDKDKYRLSREEPSAGDDSGCSTLEDHLFPDDSLSEEVLDCLVSRGVEFDSDLSTEIPDSSDQAIARMSQTRKDEGYESLQKIVITEPQNLRTSALGEVRSLLFSEESVTEASIEKPLEMGNWTLRKSSISNDDVPRLSVSGCSEPTEPAEISRDNDKSGINDSFSDSGYSSKTKLSECDGENASDSTEKPENRLSTSDESENIDWLETSSPSYVDSTFNEHFQKVLRLPMTSVFYEADVGSKVVIKPADNQQNLKVQDLEMLDDTESSCTLDTSQVEDMSVYSVSPAASPATSPRPKARVELGTGPNPSEVYV